MTVTTNNRELLRNYKALKARLITGEVEEILIPQKDNSVLKIVLQKPQTKFQSLVNKIRKKPLKNLKRPEEDIF